tara:strand:- start:28 stop:960 length:933 start_codon:yes stop_codon:yes gene_type:complete
VETGILQEITNELSSFVAQPNALRSLILLLVSVVFAYIVSHFVALGIIKIARLTASASDNATTEMKRLQYRRLETHLSVAIALVRAVIVGVVAFVAWQFISPAANYSTAAIGASAFFIVIAGATAGMILRDITAGSAMIIERWFDVGDFIRVEPFIDVSGVVERITLRSTKLRNINGEVIWLHNQQIHGVKVTPGGLRTLAVDVFVNNEKIGRSLVKRVADTIPSEPLTVAGGVHIEKSEQWGEKLWLITVIGRTPPGREWLLEDYFIDSLRDIDAKRRAYPVLVRKPIARFADPAAEQSFRRAIRANNK